MLAPKSRGKHVSGSMQTIVSGTFRMRCASIHFELGTSVALIDWHNGIVYELPTDGIKMTDLSVASSKKVETAQATTANQHTPTQPRVM